VNRTSFAATKRITLGLLLGIFFTASGAYYVRGIPDVRLPTVQARIYREYPGSPATGPLRAHPSNPRYFVDGSGKAVLLTGLHTWANFSDNGFGDPPPVFDYRAYLDFLVANNLNFTRLWAWEQACWAPWLWSEDYCYNPGPPYDRTGPGKALDGKPKFDLRRLNPSYFARLRSRVIEARDRGIYVAVMLFNGWSIDKDHGHRGNPWKGHPFNRANNISGIDGDLNRDDSGSETHQLLIPELTAYQEAYVRRVIDSVNDLDNVLFEISNESYSNSKAWQYHMIDLIHSYEATKPKQHPVGMTQYQWPGRNEDLFNSPADWIAPWEELPNYPYRDDPRPSDGKKVVIVDTDHLWGIGGDRAWAWKSFLRGNQPSFMDAYDGTAIGSGAPAAWDIRRATWKEIVKDILGLSKRPEGWEPNAERWLSLRANLGYIQVYARRINLEKMDPRPSLSSTNYCLAHESKTMAEYLIYRETSHGTISVDLSNNPGRVQVEWFNPKSGEIILAASIAGGAVRQFTPPFEGDAVLYLYSPRPSDDGAKITEFH
jgi:Family of unknown function (DUF6298)/Putative collagen-binding domain of a collagenase